jgi:hypothetical protein
MAVSRFPGIAQDRRENHDKSSATIMASPCRFPVISVNPTRVFSEPRRGMPETGQGY